MPVIQRSARVPYTALQMLTLVNAIEDYPEFLHWCHAARVEKSSGDVVEAALEIGISGIHKTMRTRNTTVAGAEGVPSTICIEMIDGPLQKLKGSWSFLDTTPSGCDIGLRLEFETHRTPFGFLLRTLFDEIANSQLNAFIRRADKVYGNA